MANPIAKMLDWAGAVTGVKSAVAALRSADTGLRRAHDAAEKERRELLSAPPPADELRAAADAEIQKLGQAWAATHRADVLAGLSAGFARGPDDAVTGLRPPAGLGNFGALTIGALCALAPALVRDGLSALLTSTGVASGPPMRDRLALLAELAGRIDQIEREHQAPVIEAKAAGIVLEEMQANRSRRLKAEQLAALTAARERDEARTRERERERRS